MNVFEIRTIAIGEVTSVGNCTSQFCVIVDSIILNHARTNSHCFFTVYEKFRVWNWLCIYDPYALGSDYINV